VLTHKLKRKEGTVILIMIASFLFIKRVNLKIYSIITLTKGMENISLIKQGIFFKEGQKPLKGGQYPRGVCRSCRSKTGSISKSREKLL